MNWTTIDTWIVFMGAMCAASCAIPGTVLVLRRMSLMGDAISHTVLPGIAVAFLITGSRDPAAMLIGAVVVGLLTAFLVQTIQSLGKVEVGASMGIVFTVLFAFGLILMRRAVDHVDIDPDCVLYGAIELAWFDQVHIAGMGVPRGFVVNGVMLISNIGLILVFYKEFKITSFDPSLAKTQGIRPSIMHYLLMTMTAVTAVAAFETVGSILVVAMFIVPAATAYLISDKYGVLMCLSVAIAIIAAALGHLGAITIQLWFGFSGTSTAGSMAVAAGFLFVVAWIGSPKYGLLTRAVHRIELRVRILREDVLGVLWRLEERKQVAIQSMQLATAIGANPLMMRFVLLRLVNQGRIAKFGKCWLLTDQGRSFATTLVRTHRLWEVYLDKHFPQDQHQLHHSASRLEHVTTESMQSALGDARTDPHGSIVPENEDV
ncbi:MAG TPA: iron ABC transporter [Phycisphaerales bacterium]|nr:iron ABC transporter [Phycisphaerales bacterium]